MVSSIKIVWYSFHIGRHISHSFLFLCHHLLEEDDPVEGDESVGHKSVGEEAWKVEEEALDGVAELVGHAADAEEDEANESWEWEDHEGTWEADDDREAVFKEVVQTSVGTVVLTLVSLLVEGD